MAGNNANEPDKNITCMYTNADSLPNKLNELSLLSYDRKPDIIAVTEVKPKHTSNPVKPSDILIPGYLEPLHNLARPGRGVCIYIKSGLKYKCEEEDSDFPHVIWINLEGKNSEPIRFGCAYRSPRSPEVENAMLNNMIANAFSNGNRNVVLVGDFNYSEVDWKRGRSTAGPEHRSTKFLETFKDTLAYQHVTKPTRHRAGQESSLVDLILTTKQELVTGNIEHLPGLGLSDHNVLIFDINFRPKQAPWRPVPLKYHYQRADFDGMRQQLANIDLANKISDMDVNSAWVEIKSTLTNLCDKFVPRKPVTIGNGRRLKPLWMNANALTKVKAKHRAYRRYLETREGQDYLEYTRVRNQASKEVRKATRTFERNLAKEAKANPKAFWNYYRARTKSPENVPDLTDADGNKVSDDSARANILNNFFCSVFTKEDMTNIPPVQPRFPTSMSDITINRDTVLKKLQGLNTRKSEGPDNINPRLLFELREQLALPLSILFSKSLTSSVIPDDWREAIVAPIHKKGDKSNAANYRPISLTCIACKLMESIIKDQLLDYLKTNDLLSHDQHGFTPGKSCVSNLLESLDSWLNDLDAGHGVDVIFLDFAKAFDSVPHERLLVKLQGIGIQDPLLCWIRNYLSNRSQRVRINNTLSDSKPVTSGVPQGSVIGPLLFLIYINDMPDETDCTSKLFADDAKAYETTTTIQECEGFQLSINSFTGWSVTWQMTFNATKCKHMRLGRQQLDFAYHMVDKEGNIHTLESVSSEKDLGVTFDNKLTFSEHIENVTKKANAVLATIKRTYTNIDIKSFTLLYKALVRPHLEYAQEVWSPQWKKDQDAIEKVQRRATKLVKQLRNMSYEERLRALRLPTLQHRRLRGDMITMYKIAHGKIKTALPIPYTENRNLRGHPLKLAPIRALHQKRGHFFTNRIVKQWNALPTDVVMSPSVNTFKSRLDEHWESTRLNIYYYRW